MFGLVGSALVIAQMAALSLGLPLHLAFLCGLGAAAPPVPMDRAARHPSSCADARSLAGRGGESARRECR